MRILDSEPKVLGIMVSSPAVRFTRILISEVREGGVSSTIPYIAVGGHHISADPRSSRLLGADTYFTGEAEYAFAEYCRAVLEGNPVSGNVSCGLINDLDALPYPARHLFKDGRYMFTSIAASRGCPFNCIYCGMAKTGYRKRSLEYIRGELDLIVKGRRAPSLDFTDDVFTLDREYTLGLSELLNDYEVAWACTTRADLVDGELLSFMWDCGCRYISFGVESGGEGIRSSIGKNISDESYKNAFKYCRELGIQTRAYGMVGLPGETRGDMEKTFDFINELEPDAVIYSPTVVYPNTTLMEYCIKHGFIRRNAWAEYMMGRAGIPCFVPDGSSLEDIRGLCYEQSKRFYLTPRQIWNRMRNASSVEDVVDSIKASVAYLAEPLFNRTC